MSIFSRPESQPHFLYPPGSTFHEVWDPELAAAEMGLDVIRLPMSIRGFYDPDREVAVVNSDLTQIQTRSVIAHEVAHHALGHIGTSDPIGRSRQEERARRWAAIRLVSIADVLEALRATGNLFEVAEELQVDPELLELRLRWLTDDEKQTIGLVDE